jgi:hypothetical protein
MKKIVESKLGGRFNLDRTQFEIKAIFERVKIS